MEEQKIIQKFPHLLPEESQIWQRFLDILGGNYDRFDYDVHVGKGAPFGKEKDEKYREMWTHLTQKRIDVIGFSAKNLTIFEVRPRADLPLLGKLIGYKQLYVASVHPTLNILLAVVSDRVDDDDAFVFSQNAVKIFIV